MSNDGAQERPGADTLEQAVRMLLRSVPETWSEYDRAALTEPCEQGLALLVAAGMVEQRWSFRLRMFGHPVVVEATASVTGEYGAVEALERVAAGMWEQWRDAWQERMKGPTKDAPAFHCERIGREQWRLTADGIRAREDLETDAATVFDFVLKRGFFDGWSRLSPDGRISQRLPVRGKGALEKMELVKADAPGPAGVSIANWGEGGKAFADAFAGLFAAMQAKAILPTESCAPTSQSRPAEFAFYREGDGWTIRGFGQEGHFKDKIGFQFLAKLLAAPQGTVSMMDLVAEGLAPQGTVTMSDWAAEGESCDTGVPAGDMVLDREAMNSYRRHLDYLDDQIARARRHHDPGAVESLEQERQLVLDTLASAMGLDDRGRRLGDDLDRLRSRVAGALKRCYKAIRQAGLDKLADHFEGAVSAAGPIYSYRPAEQPDWRFSKF